MGNNQAVNSSNIATNSLCLRSHSSNNNNNNSTPSAQQQSLNSITTTNPTNVSLSPKVAGTSIPLDPAPRKSSASISIMPTISSASALQVLYLHNIYI